MPIGMRDDYSIEFGETCEPIKPVIQDFLGLKNQLKNPNGAYSRRDVYHIYQDAILRQHKEKLGEANLRYDIIVLPPGKCGDEFIKTRGYYLSNKTGTDVSYPEVLEIIYGKAFVLVQKPAPDPGRLEKIFLVEVNRGEKLLILPSFGNVKINPLDDVLVMARWRAKSAKEIFETYESYNGGGYYILESQHLAKTGKTHTDFDFSPNLNYKQVALLSKVVPRELPQYDLITAIPMYFTATRNAESLNFLFNPENYLDQLVDERTYKNTS